MFLNFQLRTTPSINNTVYYRRHKNWSVGKKIGKENAKSGRFRPSGGLLVKGVKIEKTRRDRGISHVWCFSVNFVFCICAHLRCIVIFG